MTAPTSEQKLKRVRPWRCRLCGDRFATDQTSARHICVYDPREWEQR